MDFLKKKLPVKRFVIWFFLLQSLLFCIIGLGYLKSIIGSGTLFQNNFFVFSNWMQKSLVMVFAIGNYLSYMMLLAFLPAIPILIIACFNSNKRLIMLLSILAASISITLLIIDYHVYQMFKFHLNPTLLEMLCSRQMVGVFDFSSSEIMLFIGMELLIVIIECLLAWFVWKKIVIPHRFLVGKTIATLWLGLFLICYFTLLISLARHNNLFCQQTPNLPLFSQVYSYLIPGKNAADILFRYSENRYSQPLYSNQMLNYPLNPLKCNKPQQPYNIILIMVDSLRFDSLKPATMPVMAKFAEQSWQFTNHLSGGNCTQPGIFSLFYSLPTSYWTATLEQKKSPVLIDELIRNNYQHQILWAENLIHPPFQKTVFNRFADLNVYGSPGEDIGDKDRFITNKAIDFLNTNKSQKPFFLSLFYDAAHAYCREQSFPEYFKPIVRNCIRLGITNETDPIPYSNRYLNSVHFIDSEIARVMAVIEQMGYLNNSIIIFTSDHGQEFNDNKQNYWEHSGNYTNAQIHIPLVIRWPEQQPKIINYQTSSYDITPTLMQNLFNCQNPIEDYSVGQNLLKKDGRLPFILSGSYVNLGIVEANTLTTLQASGMIVITNKKAVPLPDAKVNKEILNQALYMMRKYYVQ